MTRSHEHVVWHQDIARQCLAAPWEWVSVRVYVSRSTAMQIARYIERGEKLNAYLPAASYEARFEMVDDGYEVFARYVGLLDQQPQEES